MKSVIVVSLLFSLIAEVSDAIDLSGNKYYCHGNLVKNISKTNVYSSSDHKEYGLEFIDLWIRNRAVKIKGTNKEFDPIRYNTKLTLGPGLRYRYFYTSDYVTKNHWFYSIQLNENGFGLLELAGLSGSVRFYRYTLDCIAQ